MVDFQVFLTADEDKIISPSDFCRSSIFLFGAIARSASS
jgi:hypothetical protein